MCIFYLLLSCIASYCLHEGWEWVIGCNLPITFLFIKRKAAVREWHEFVGYVRNNELKSSSDLIILCFWNSWTFMSSVYFLPQIFWNIRALQLNTHTHTRTASSYCRLVTWEQRFPPTLKGNDLCLRVRRPSTLRLPSLWGISDYVFCQCVCGNLLICTNTDSNAPAIAGFLADGWLGCRLMAESVGPQLGAGNIAHYTFSRRGKANSHGCAACRCRCNHIILNHRSVTHRQSLGSCQRDGWSLIKAQPKTKWHVLNLIRGDVKQTITYPSRCEAHPAETLSPEWIFILFLSFFL